MNEEREGKERNEEGWRGHFIRHLMNFRIWIVFMRVELSKGSGLLLPLSLIVMIGILCDVSLDEIVTSYWILFDLFHALLTIGLQLGGTESFPTPPPLSPTYLAFRLFETMTPRSVRAVKHTSCRSAAMLRSRINSIK
jgi:hypothetical protein